jgi:ornithine carbamoyltransferase
MVLYRAQQHAKGWGQPTVEPEHLLLGLLDEHEAVATYLLARLAVRTEALRKDVEAHLTHGGIESEGEPALSPEGKVVMDTAGAIAAELGDEFVGTEHMLLGLALAQTGAQQRLATAGVSEKGIRKEFAGLHREPRQTPHDHPVPGESSVHRIARAILREAIKLGANDLSLHQDHAGVHAILTVHGATADLVTMPAHILSPLVSAFRTMADRPGGNGAISITVEGKPYDVVIVPGASVLTLGILERDLPTRRSGTPSQRMATPEGGSIIADVLTEHALRGRDILGIEDLSHEELLLILDVAARLKASKFDATQTLFAKGQTLVMLFEKPSLRTRVTFEAGMTQLGGHAIYINDQLGVRESVPDVARNIDRWVDGIMARTFAHQTVRELAEYARIPVINGLSDREHPCQALADFQTIIEHKGAPVGLRMAYIGDGNNMANSLMLMAGKLGTHFTIACPSGYEPDAEIWQKALHFADITGAQMTKTDDPLAAVKDADIVYTDVWTSMGQEEEAAVRRKVFAPYQLNAALVAGAKPTAIVMHCLPAHRGEEITDDVLDGPQSVVFDQAENRLHAQKAIIALIL